MDLIGRPSHLLAQFLFMALNKIPLAGLCLNCILYGSASVRKREYNKKQTNIVKRQIKRQTP